MILSEPDKKFQKNRRNIEDFSKDFISNKDIPKYVFGNTKYSRSIMQNIKLDGIIEDNPSSKDLAGIPFVTLDKVEKNALIVICCINFKTASKKISNFGLKFLDYFTFFKYNHKSIPLIDMPINIGFSDCYKENINEISKIHDLLYDEKSREIFSKIINFRLNYDIEYIKDFTNNEKNQYFEPFLKLSKSEENFIDIGGYDGHTSLEFIKRFPKYNSIHVFEPIASNNAICKDRLSKFRDITHYDIALSDKKGCEYFFEQGSSSASSVNGKLKVKTDKLDNILPINIIPTFLKFDIEGGELKAIKGAKNIIKKYRPKMAISIYHRPDDFYKIPNEVLSICNDYKIYVRHYGEGIYETIMFFIPKSSN